MLSFLRESRDGERQLHNVNNSVHKQCMDLAHILTWTAGARLRAGYFHGRAERSTLPPEKMIPSLGAGPSGRLGRLREARTPGLSKGAIATALEGSMMIFMRSQTRRAAEMISSSLTSRMRSR